MLGYYEMHLQKKRNKMPLCVYIVGLLLSKAPCQDVWPSQWRHSYLLGINFNLEWISNYTHYKAWVGIIHPFPNFNAATVLLPRFGKG